MPDASRVVPSRARRRWWAAAAVVAALAVALVVANEATQGQLLGGGSVEEWHWDKPARVDGRVVHLTFEGSSCDDERWVDVDETDETVTLTVKTRERRGSCTGTGRGGLRLDARLEEPLGDRTLVDGACESGDEPARGNCPSPVQTGVCDGADYRVDMPVDVNGDVTLRVQLSHAAPDETWHFSWRLKSYRDSDEARTEVSADSGGELVATHEMADLSAIRGREVEFAPPGGALCRVTGHMPMSYGS
jgi:hypothetical protein